MIEVDQGQLYVGKVVVPSIYLDSTFNKKIVFSGKNTKNFNIWNFFYL